MHAEMSFLYYIGCSIALILVLKIVLPFAYVFYAYTIGKRFSKRKLLKSAGEWAIVTGSTAGIGKAYAKELAKEGLNIMLVSRNMDKLKDTAKEIESRYGVTTKVIACDFTQADIYENLSKEINSLESIACLVNNVGMSYPKSDQFSHANFMDLDFIRSLLNCNMTSTASLTRIVLPIMIKQNRRGAAIINISSFSGLYPFPYLALYGASKSFVHHFTRALTNESETSIVTFQTVCPMLVSTTMSKVKRTSFFIPSAEDYAKSALDMLGVESLTMGCFAHALQAAVLSIHPQLVAWVAKGMYKRCHRKKS